MPYLVAGAAAVLVDLVLLTTEAVLLTALVVGFVTVSVALGDIGMVRRGKGRTVLRTVGPALLFVVVVGARLPLRCTFLLCRSEFERAARKIEAEAPLETPFWIGPFRILDAGLMGDGTYAPILFAHDRAHETAFFRRPDGSGLGPWTCIRLDDNWSLVTLD
jgi:hypothetical protein